jgi:hypothetical protein
MSDSMTMPNFLLLGTMKAGTTSLYYQLKQHPQIYMSPVKAPDFFAIEGRKWDFNGPKGQDTANYWTSKHKATTLEEFCALFKGVSDEIAIGEASPSYLYRPEAPSRIKHYIPEAKLIAMLRNPADRAYSQYCFARLAGREPFNDFAQALQAEEERTQNGYDWLYHYKGFGFYYTQLKRYYEMFEPEKIRVYLYDDLQDDPIGVVQDIFRYLGVDDAFIPESSWRYNPGGIPKNSTLHRVLKKPSTVKQIGKSVLPDRWGRATWERIMSLNLTKAPPLKEEVRRELIEVFRQDVLNLQGLIERDLSGWLQMDNRPAHKGQVSSSMIR